jgi:hypothetical protein
MLISLSTTNIKDAAKQGLILSMQRQSHPKDQELFSEYSGCIEIDSTLGEQSIWFYVDKDGFKYDFNFSNYFPKVNIKVIHDEITHRNEQFIHSGKLQRLVEYLHQNPMSKRAIIDIRKEQYYDLSIWCVCITHLFFRITNAWLDIHIHSRANNAYKLLFLDMQAMVAIQHYVANQLWIKSNAYIHFIDSLHIYKEDYEDILFQLEYIQKSNFRN